MARKTKNSDEQPAKAAERLSASVKESAQQIWLAGMGAFSKAQAEGGKAFENLVKDGLSLQRKTQAVAEETISGVTGRMNAVADTVTQKAGQNWDKLESIFEARTAKAMNKLGVPTAKDVDALVKRVDELAAAVARLSRQQATAAKAPRSRKAAAEPAPTAPIKTTPKKAPKTAPKAAPEAASQPARKRAARKKAAGA
jgi:poly(hydroxyalkanoate) granule-associated protein